MNFIRTLFGKPQDSKNVPPPSAEILEEAKKIFFEYSGNRLHMAQNDVNFSQYHIGREQEAEWRNELIAYWRSQLSTEDLTAVRKLIYAEAVEAVPDLFAMVGKGDSYANLRVAEALWALSYRIKDKTLQKQTKSTAMQIAKSILDRPIQVSESHRIEMKSLGGTDPKEYITLFARKVVNDDK